MLMIRVSRAALRYSLAAIGDSGLVIPTSQCIMTEYICIRTGLHDNFIRSNIFGIKVSKRALFIFRSV
jgi:hypothetical protein